MGKRSLAVILKGTAISVALYGIGIAFAISDEALACWLCGLGSVIVASVAVIRSFAMAISHMRKEGNSEPHAELAIIIVLLLTLGVAFVVLQMAILLLYAPAH